MSKYTNRLKAYRSLHNLKQEDIAKVIGISLSSYSYKEKGIRQFSLEEAKVICDYFGVSIEEIFFNKKVNIVDTTRIN